MNDFARQFMNECQDISNNLIATGQNLYAAINDDIEAKRNLRDAEEMLSNAEAEIIAEATIRAATEKAGPLAGIAATSSAFKSAVEAMIARERHSNPQIAQLLAHVIRCRNVADQTTILREGTAVTFSALRHAADLRAAMLRSMTD